MGIKFDRKTLAVAATVTLLMGAAPMAYSATSWWWYRGGPRKTSTNTAPTISGTPVTSVVAGNAYRFTPTASDQQTTRLTFSIANKPAWASFSSSTGTLSGTPTAAQAGSYGNIVISVSDGALKSSLPAFGITVQAAPATANTAPSISGTPATSVTAGSNYSFVPAASDLEGQALGFSVSNKPAWAAFSTATGALTGTPASTDVGTYGNIVVSVSDGTLKSSLPAFAINVTEAAAVYGSATLTWAAPSRNTDGSSLVDLAGYRVYHGTAPGALNEIITVSGAATTSYAFTRLARGTHYFAVAAYTNAGLESALSTTGSKTIQ